MEISDKERKEIYQIRKKRREEKKNPTVQETDPEKIRKQKLVDKFMREMVPSYCQLQEKLEEAADSAWFAWSEFERIERHMKDVHANDCKQCKEGCLEDFTLEDGKEYAEIIMKEIEKTAQ